MKKILLIYIWLCFSFSSFSQIISINEGTSFYVPESVLFSLSDEMNFINDSELSTFKGIVKFTGTGEQLISGRIPISFLKLVIDNEVLIIHNDVMIFDQLDMQNGIINLADNNLTVDDNAVISGSFSEQCMIAINGNGELIRKIDENGVYLFPIGDISLNYDYSPAEINFTSGNYSDASVMVRVVNRKHPENSSIDNYLNRYWQISAEGISDQNYEVILNFVEDDVIGNESEIYSALYTNSWDFLEPIFGNQIIGNLVEFGYLTGGEKSAMIDIASHNNDQFKLTGINDGFIIFGNTKNVLNVDVYNLIGQKIYSQKEIISNEITLNNPISTGIYLIRVQTIFGNYSEKIMIY